MESYDQDELERQVEYLGARDWRLVLAAQGELLAAGEAGLSAALGGLSHAVPRVRRGCADFLDHYGTDACVDALRHAALSDPVPSVRRAAVHALLCQRCKPCPLTSDLTEFLVQVALEEPNPRVRGEAIWGLGAQPPDPRIAAALRQILANEAHPGVLQGAHQALLHQDPGYREAVHLNARMRGLLRAHEGRAAAGAVL